MLSIILTLIIVGVALYLVTLIPMDPTVKRIIHVLIILFAVIWVLESLGILARIH